MPILKCNIQLSDHLLMARTISSSVFSIFLRVIAVTTNYKQTDSQDK